MCVQWQDIDTQGASDAEIVKLSSATDDDNNNNNHHHRYLLVVANSRSNAGLSRVISTVHEWDNSRRRVCYFVHTVQPVFLVFLVIHAY